MIHIAYLASKASSDFGESLHSTYGLPVLLSNCSNNYGPRSIEKAIPTVIPPHFRKRYSYMATV